MPLHRPHGWSGEILWPAVPFRTLKRAEARPLARRYIPNVSDVRQNERERGTADNDALLGDDLYARQPFQH